MFFWLKTKGGWREVDRHEMTGLNSGARSNCCAAWTRRSSRKCFTLCEPRSPSEHAIWPTRISWYPQIEPPVRHARGDDLSRVPTPRVNSQLPNYLPTLKSWSYMVCPCRLGAEVL